jgi:hypothetical protein
MRSVGIWSVYMSSSVSLHAFAVSLPAIPARASTRTLVVPLSTTAEPARQQQQQQHSSSSSSAQKRQQQQHQ